MDIVTILEIVGGLIFMCLVLFIPIGLLSPRARHRRRWKNEE